MTFLRLRFLVFKYCHSFITAADYSQLCIRQWAVINHAIIHQQVLQINFNKLSKNYKHKTTFCDRAQNKPNTLSVIRGRKRKSNPVYISNSVTTLRVRQWPQECGHFSIASSVLHLFLLISSRHSDDILAAASLQLTRERQPAP